MYATILYYLHYIEDQCLYKLFFFLTVRLILAAVVATAWTKLKRVITKIYGSDVSFWFSLITLTQFHFIFYMSRTLPNIMALPLGMSSK